MKMIKTPRIFGFLMIWVLILVSVSAPLYFAGEPEKPVRSVNSSKDADEWIRVFLGENPQVLDGAWQMTAQMDAAAAMAGGMKGLAASLSSLGEVKKIGSAYEGKKNGYQAFFIPCVFSAMSADLILVMDQGAIAGLVTGPYTGETEASLSSGAFNSQELALPIPGTGKELPGTLTLPEGEGPFPVVILVHGSGPNDRDETISGLKPFRDLAEGLAEEGIAVYRYDKRTYVYGSDMVSDHGITLEDETIQDAAAAVQLMAQQEQIDSSRIYVLGHSLGGYAVPAIDQALSRLPVAACGYILMAAPARSLDDLMKEQYDYLYSLLPEVTPQQEAEKDSLFRELDRLKDVDSLSDDDLIAGAYAPYWKWLALYDVLEAADAITEPCLLLQGEEDYQVTMEDFSAWKEALGEKENWQLISYPGLTHPFTPGKKTDGAAAYAVPAHVDPKVISDIASFIL